MRTDVVSSETRDKLVASGCRVAFQPHRNGSDMVPHGAPTPADPYAGLTDDPLPSFVRDCLDAGFTPDATLWLRRLASPFQVFANWVRWTDGSLWFAMPHCCKLAAHGHCQLPRTCTLSDFVAAPRPPSQLASRRVVPQQRSLFE